MTSREENKHFFNAIATMFDGIQKAFASEAFARIESKGCPIYSGLMSVARPFPDVARLTFTAEYSFKDPEEVVLDLHPDGTLKPKGGC